MSEHKMSPKMKSAHQIMESIVSLCCDCRQEFVTRGIFEPKVANDVVMSAIMSAAFTMIVRDLGCDDPQIITEAMRDMHKLSNNEFNQIRQKIVDAMKAKRSMN